MMVLISILKDADLELWIYFCQWYTTQMLNVTGGMMSQPAFWRPAEFRCFGFFFFFFSYEQKITCVAAECHIGWARTLKGENNYRKCCFFFFSFFFSLMSTVMGKNERGVCTLLKIVPPLSFSHTFVFLFREKQGGSVFQIPNKEGKHGCHVFSGFSHRWYRLSVKFLTCPSSHCSINVPQKATASLSRMSYELAFLFLNEQSDYLISFLFQI